jgi:hypothetical protein
VSTTAAGTTTLEYWAVVPSSGEVLYAIRDVVIPAPANDNQPTDDTLLVDTHAPDPAPAPELEPANVNTAPAELPATGTE